MDFADERIALLEREFRKQKWEEQEKEKQEAAPKEEAKTLSFEEILAGVREGGLVFPNKETFYFEIREYFEDQIPMARFSHFFTAVEEKEGVTIYVNHDREVSQLITVADKPHQKERMDVSKKRMENGMRAVGTYAKVEKKQELNYVDYLSYRTPTKKGWVFNLIFRVRYGSSRVIGNYNCYEKDKETIGLILEALICRMDELLTERSRKEKKED